MNDYIIIGIIAVVILAGLGITAFLSKKKKEKIVEKFPELTGREKNAYHLAWDAVGGVGEPPRCYVVRNASKSISFLGGKKFKNFRVGNRDPKSPKGYAGLYKGGTVYINLDRGEGKIEYFALVAVHELNHVKGMGHGEHMEHADSEAWAKIKDKV